MFLDIRTVKIRQNKNLFNHSIKIMIAKICQDNGGVCARCPHNPPMPGALKLCEHQYDVYEPVARLAHKPRPTYTGWKKPPKSNRGSQTSVGSFNYTTDNFYKCYSRYPKNYDENGQEQPALTGQKVPSYLY